MDRAGGLRLSFRGNKKCPRIRPGGVRMTFVYAGKSDKLQKHPLKITSPKV